MVDDLTNGSTPAPRCPWCSAQLASENEATCPSCRATLVGEGDSQVPGVTAIDAEAIVRAAHGPRPKPRSRLLSWISGEYEEETATPAPPGSLAPPPPNVRREMLRLEQEALVANLQAEAEAQAADAAIEAGGGVPLELATIDAPAPDAAPDPVDAPAPDADARPSA